VIVSAIVSSIDIARPAADVFSYVTDPSHFAEWQANVVSGRLVSEGPASVGTECVTTRRIGGSNRTSTSEITAIDPPTYWADHGIDGPIRAIVNVGVESPEVDRARVTISLDFEGHGIGTLLVPLVVRRQAARELPANMHRLKERLEQTA
jgi:uncharacterized protein YndB with AHSA1/START domain